MGFEQRSKKLGIGSGWRFFNIVFSGAICQNTFFPFKYTFSNRPESEICVQADEQYNNPLYSGWEKRHCSLGHSAHILLLKMLPTRNKLLHWRLLKIIRNVKIHWFLKKIGPLLLPLIYNNKYLETLAYIF